ncbi:Phosphoglucomutase-2 [Ceratobasidium sp. 423]|nr:Phosphoglucomutase-2 [Ceratobasidium sp. 423]
MSRYNIQEVQTKPYEGQKPGTSGLRKRVKIFEQEHYTENFIQAILDAMPAPGVANSTLVIGGDGRYHSKPTVQSILKIAAANGVKKLYIGHNAILSTPAASNIIRQYKADGGILLTASHNPGGPNNDFGIKYNVSNGGPAPENVTDKIFQRTKEITSYKVLDAGELDLSKIGKHTYGPMEVEIIDSVKDYIALLKEIFDFSLIKNFLHANPSYRVLFDGLNGVTGPYAKAIFLDELALAPTSVQQCEPLPDFGGAHPDPNLTYAHSLVEVVERDNIPFGAASDGDGDRNMIYGKGAFVTPSDSVAVIADWAHEIPYFKKTGIRGLARSMPTSNAIDYVAKAKGVEVFEVPTGWKFFGNLMDAGRLSICGEESFGTGSDHIREKDGLWAVVAWLNIIAVANQTKPGTGINELLQDHYSKYGRSFFSRYDYEEVSSEGAKQFTDNLDALFADSSFVGSKQGAFTVARTTNFSYTDPIDGSVSKNQGHIVLFEDGSRVVFRLSGTGSQGATVRMYIERYSKDAAQFKKNTAEGLQPLIDAALEFTKLKQYLGRDEPTVITFTMTPNRPLPGRKLVLHLIRILRFGIALYVAGLSIATIIVSGITMNVGGIIASVYLIPASLILLALEFGYLCSRVGVLKYEMQPLRIIALQFISAMITGIAWPELVFFIFGCVAFGLTLGLMNLVGIYYLFWRHHAQEDGLYAWGEDGEKSPRAEGQIFLNTGDGEEDALLLENGSGVDIESARTSQTSSHNGPEIMSVD